MIDTINDYNKATDSESDHRSDHSSWSPPVPVPHIELSVPAASDTPPTPADSVVDAVHDFGSDQPTMVWMTEQEQVTVLEDRLAAAQETLARLERENAEADRKLGLLGYQLESTENQNAAMSRAMSEKDAMIKKQDLGMKKQGADIKAKDAQLVGKGVETARHVAEIKEQRQQLGARNALINKANPGSKFEHHTVPKGPKLTHAR